VDKRSKNDPAYTRELEKLLESIQHKHLPS